MVTPNHDLSWRVRAVSPRRAGLSVALAVGLFTAAIWLGAVQHWHSTAADQRQSLANQTALRLHDWVGSRILVLDAVRSMRAQGLLSTSADWRTWVAQVMGTIDGFQAINWLEADGLIQITAPAEGNEAALGKHVSQHPVAGPAFTDAARTKRTQASPPLELFQGGRAFTTYLPVTQGNDEVLGFVNGVFGVNRLVTHALDHIDLDHTIVVVEDSGDLLWSSDPALDLSASRPPTVWAQAPLGVLQRTWVVSLRAATPVVPVLWHIAALAITLSLSLGAGLVAHKLARQAQAAAAARAESQRLAAQLMEAERLESLGRVAGGIAHDFNNVLTIVIGRASMLQNMRGPQDTDVFEVTTAILDAGDRAAQLIDTLLTFARRGDDVVGRVDSAAHLTKAQPLLRHLAGRGRRVSVRVDTQTAPIALAASALDRLLVNLVANATQATSAPGGEIDIILDRSDGRVRLRVEDNGSGMDAATRTRIFEPFFTTKPTGSGLGLATVFGLVRQAGGTIFVDTAPDAGTRFTLEFPPAAAD